jgi:AraC-like DNA-binding protein
MPLSRSTSSNYEIFTQVSGLNADICLADCAIKAGFFDQSHFKKTFKQVEKIPPSQFRRKYKKWAGKPMRKIN